MLYISAYIPVETWRSIFKLTHFFANSKTCLAPNVLISKETSYLIIKYKQITINNQINWCAGYIHNQVQSYAEN